MPYKDHNKQLEYSREYSKKWYKKNKKEHIKGVVERNKRKRKVSRDIVNKYKKERGCSICGITDPRCLEFHHKDSTKKEAYISKLVNSGYSTREIMKEIKKCSVMCSNHHRIIHATLL